jgi:hypothetical protein
MLLHVHINGKFTIDFMQGLLKKNEKKLSRSFNFTLHYIYDLSNERYILHMQVLLECYYTQMESSQWENWKHLFCRKVSFLTAPHCQNYSIQVWLKIVRSLTQIRIKKIYHQHVRVLVDMFFNRQSVYLWVQTVLLFSPTCSFICMFCRKVSFLTAPHCQFRCVGQGMKQTYLHLWYPLFQVQWDRCNQRNHQT